MKTSTIVTARYYFNRYKEKTLAKILGIEMVLRVADICSKVIGKNDLYIVTDRKKIEKVASPSGYKCIFTSKKCLTGTDRVAEASKKIIDAKRRYLNEVICGYTDIQKNEYTANKNIPKTVDTIKNIFKVEKILLKNYV